MSDERLKILEALASGAITADEANAQLQGLRSEAPAAEPAAPPPPAEPKAKIDIEIDAATSKAETTEPQTQAEPRWLRIHITDRATQQKRVNISVPLGIVKLGWRLGEKFGSEWPGPTWEALRTAIQEGTGLVLHVEGEAEQVDVLVE